MLTDMVTDEDRKAAAEIYQNRRDHDMHKWILYGRCDADTIVQAFARQRLLGYQQGMEDAAVVMAERAAMYRAKASKHDPFADDNLNTYDSLVVCAEASEYGEAAIRAKAEEKKHGTR